MKRKSVHRCFAVLVFVIVLVAPAVVLAVIPATVNYQGYLTNPGGVPVNGSVSMTFRVYDTASGGTSLWEETLSIDVSNGVYSVVLGTTNPLDITWWSYPAAYLGVTVGTDAEMTPRQELTSVPYALSANDARWSEMAYDLNCTGCVSQSELNFTPGDITGVAPGTGLSGGGITGDITLDVDTSLIQSRVSGACAVGSSIRVINQNGTVVCETDDNTSYTPGTGLDLVGTTFNLEVPLSLTGTDNAGSIINGTNAGTSYAVYGFNSGSANWGALASGSYGVYGANATSGVGVYGRSTNGNGVYGYSQGNNNYGILGTSAYGVYGSGVVAGGYFTSPSGYGLIVAAGNVGIGTSVPNEQLEITGNLRLPASTSTTGIIRSGGNTLLHTFGSGNFFAGISSGNLTMSGIYNTAIGESSFTGNTTGAYNVAVGSYALESNTQGYDNIAIGDSALNGNTIGTNNTAVGSAALFSNTTSSKNTAVGGYALFTQSYNNNGLQWDTNNTAIGFEALYSTQPTSDVSGRNNTAVGSLALRSNVVGNRNTAVGVGALEMSLGYDNTAVGDLALNENGTAGQNVAVGSAALQLNTTGEFNTAVGTGSASANVSGSNNTIIGAWANVSGTVNNATAIGATATVDASNKVVIGNSSVTSIGGYAPWSNYSDERVKTDIRDIEHGIDIIASLRPVQYRMKNGNGNTDFGFIAQDIEALLGDQYNVLDVGAGDDRMLSLRYTQFIAPMVKAIQQQQEIIEELRAENAAFKVLLCQDHPEAKICQ